MFKPKQEPELKWEFELKNNRKRYEAATTLVGSF